MSYNEKSSVGEVSDIEKVIEIQLAETRTSNVENEQIQKRKRTYLDQQQNAQYKIIITKFLGGLSIGAMI